MQAGVQTPKTKQGGQARVGRGTAAHNIWEMDSKEAIQLGSGEKVSWLVVSDEASGAVLGGTVFPPLRLKDRKYSSNCETGLSNGACPKLSAWIMAVLGLPKATFRRL